MNDIALASIGDPRGSQTWSGTPRNLILALEAAGCCVTTVDLQLPAVWVAALKGLSLGTGMGTHYLRTRAARRVVGAQGRLRNVVRQHKPVIHMGTQTMPVAPRSANERHFVYMDSTFHMLCERGLTRYSARQRMRFDDLERKSLHGAEHLFPISEYVRDDLIEHYGVPAERITVAGTGRGKVSPYLGPKRYRDGSILFVAKERFEEKGGRLLLDAFRHAAQVHPKLTLVMVCEPQYQPLVESVPNAIFKTSLPWSELEGLFQQAALFAMPALHEPWGLVYLEALASRCPVVGLDRNALPEITGGGKYGFLAGQATPEAIGDVLIRAFADAPRLQAMGAAGQEHCLATYSWTRTAALIRERVAAELPQARSH